MKDMTRAWVLDTLQSGMSCSLWTLQGAVKIADRKRVEGIANELVEEGYAYHIKKHVWHITEEGMKAA